MMIKMTSISALGILLQLPSFPYVQLNLFNLIVLVLLVDGSIVAVWYIIGAILGNGRIKSSARGEFEQFAGTVIMLAIVMGVILFVGYTYYSALNQTSQYPTSVPTILSIGSIRNSYCVPLSTSAYSFIYAMVQPMCAGVIDPLFNNAGPPPDPTLYTDLPLANAGIVTASLAQQVADNLNSTFIVDSYLQFLSRLTPNAALCFQLTPPDTDGCFGAPGPPFTFKILVSGQPLSGLQMITQSLTTFSTITYTSMVMFIVELMFTLIFLYTWPYLVFFGFALRATPYTRKVGGLLIAVGLGGVLFYPTVFSMEYLAAYNSALTAGFYPQSGITFCNNGSYTYYENFFQLPSVSGIAQDCGCWPKFGLLATESIEATLVSSPGYVAFAFYDGFAKALLSIIYDIFVKHSTSSLAQQLASDLQQEVSGPFSYQNMFQFLGSFGSCGPETPQSGGEGMLFGMLEVYGIIGVSSYFLPVLNTLIALSAIRGLSGILGGDTSLAGLSRII